MTAQRLHLGNGFAPSNRSPAVPPSSGQPKLLDRVRHAIRVRHYSRRTEEAYVHWIRRYIVFHGKAHPSTLGASEISAFLTWLAVRQRVSASTQNQALSALLFLHRDVLGMEVGAIGQVPRARVPARVPVVLSRDEVGAVMKHVTGTVWIIVVLLYGAGLRIQECLELRVMDIDFDRHQIVVRRGKGQKDRRTMLPVAVRERSASTSTISRTARGASSCRSRSIGSIRTHQRTGPGSLCFPPHGCVAIRGGVRRRGITCTRRLSRKRWPRRCGTLVWRSGRAHTRFVIHSRRICSRTATTFAPCRSCSGIGT